MSKKYRRIKKTLALTLALVMVLGILPLGIVASADEDTLEIDGFGTFPATGPDAFDPETHSWIVRQYGDVIEIKPEGATGSGEDIESVTAIVEHGSVTTITTITPEDNPDPWIVSFTGVGKVVLEIHQPQSGTDGNASTVRLYFDVGPRIVDVDASIDNLEVSYAFNGLDTVNIPMTEIEGSIISFWSSADPTVDPTTLPGWSCTAELTFASVNAVSQTSTLYLTLGNSTLFTFSNGTNLLERSLSADASRAITATDNYTVDIPGRVNSLFTKNDASHFMPGGVFLSGQLVTASTNVADRKPIDDPIRGTLNWFVGGTVGTPLTPTNLEATGFGGDELGLQLTWQFIPTGVGPLLTPSILANYGTKTGQITVRVFDGEILSSGGLHVRNITPGPINVTYTGNRQAVIDRVVDPSVSYDHIASDADLPGISRDKANALKNFTGWTFEVTYYGDIEDGTKYNEARTPNNQAPTDAGKYKILVVGTATLTGTFAGEYRIERTIDLNINRIKLEWRQGIVVDRPFDGTVNVDIVGRYWFENVLTQDMGEVRFTGGSAQFASPHVGTHTIIRIEGFANATLTGTREHNYEAPTTSPTFGPGTITPRNVVIYPDGGQSKKYMHRDNDPPLTFRLGTSAATSEFLEIMDRVSSGMNHTAWLGREAGEEIGTYPFVINQAVISDNFNVSFPTIMPTRFAIVPTGVENIDHPTIPTTIRMNAFEAYSAWQTASATTSRNVQPFVDLAISLGRLPNNVRVNTESRFDDRWGDEKTYTHNVPMTWATTAPTQSVNPNEVGANGAKGGTYDNLRGTLDLSNTKEVVNNTEPLTRTLVVHPIEFVNTAANEYKVNHAETFGDADVLIKAGANSVSASELPDILPKSGYLTFRGNTGGQSIPNEKSVRINYTINWLETSPRLDMTKKDEFVIFTGEIVFTDSPDIPGPLTWFTQPTDRRVERKVTVHEVLPIAIDFNASDTIYNGAPWAGASPPIVTVNGKAVADQPDPSAFSWYYRPQAGGPRNVIPPVNVGDYEVRVSIEAYGDYRAATNTETFEIKPREIELVATDITVDKGQFVGGGSPSIGFTVENLAPGDRVADALYRNPTLRIDGFDGSKVGTYDLVFATRGIELGSGVPPANTGTQNYKIIEWYNGKVHVVEPSEPTFRVSVVGGTVAGGGSFAEYAAGTVVTITANAPAAGSRFAGWTSTPSVSFASAASRTTTFTMPAREIAISATFASAPQTPTIPKEPIFPDLTSGPAFNAVQWAATMRIIEGRDGLFHPKEQISRAQFAVILHRYAGRPNVSSTVSFTDVTPGTTIGRAVAWAVDKGITSGRSSTVFGINDIISRELMMVMLYNYHTKVDNGSGGANANALARFTDRGDVSAGALNAMRWAVENNLLTGQGGKILPKASMTRDQLVTILYRYDKAFN